VFTLDVAQGRLDATLTRHELGQHRVVHFTLQDGRRGRVMDE
jgi:hypothetical protein